MSNDSLNERQKKFCSEYIFDWNATRAYQTAYPDSSYEAARSSAVDLLTKPNIKQYIESIQKDLEKEAGISRLKVLREHEKMAFSSIAHLHNTWIDRKDFESLTKEQKDCISEIDTKVIKRNIGTKDEPDMADVEQIKIRLYDKQKALEAISKMLGYNEPDTIEVKGMEIIVRREKKPPIEDR